MSNLIVLCGGCHLAIEKMRQTLKKKLPLTGSTKIMIIKLLNF